MARGLRGEGEEEIGMIPSDNFKNPERIHLSILAPLEKECLIRIARKLPVEINSDHLTALGFLGMLGAGLCFYLGQWNRYMLIAAILCLFVNWFGDSLDGTLARVRNQQRPRYGFYVDHILDAIGILALLAGMGFSGYMTPWITAGVLITYYLINIEICLATVSLGKFRLSFGIMGPTELRIVLAAACIILMFRPFVHLFGSRFLLLDVGGVVTMIGLFITTIILAISNGRELYRLERLT